MMSCLKRVDVMILVWLLSFDATMEYWYTCVRISGVHGAAASVERRVEPRKNETPSTSVGPSSEQANSFWSQVIVYTSLGTIIYVLKK